MKKLLFSQLFLIAVLGIIISSCSSKKAQIAENQSVTKVSVAETAPADVAEVYFTKDISPEGLMKVYKALGRDLQGKVAVKISTGEAGNHHYLSPDLIKDLVKAEEGTIVECNTAYGGKRADTESHRKVAEEHGFTAIAAVDIMDEKGSIALPFPEGKRIQEDFVGANFKNYESWLVLSHFKGHEMAGFGGALKNLSIGIASIEGKAWIHSGGTSRTNPWGGKQEAFLEAMAEAAGAVIRSIGSDKIIYVNVLNHLSIDCDCSGNPTPPELDDIGIVASLDPVAVDKAAVDLIYQSDTQRSKSLRERIEKKQGMLTVTHAEELGLGTQKYKLMEIK
jgi:uncharacterized Fe-S center protein